MLRSTCRHVALLLSQSRTVPSSLPLASNPPLAASATPRTALVWPFRVATGCLVVTSHNHTLRTRCSTPEQRSICSANSRRMPSKMPPPELSRKGPRFPTGQHQAAPVGSLAQQLQQRRDSFRVSHGRNSLLVGQETDGTG
jgi:hypothetical protein